MSTTYIAFETKEQRLRFRQECARLGYPVSDEHPRSDHSGIWDPGVPSGMPDDLRNRAYQYAMTGIIPSDLKGQHPEFKYLRVSAKQ